MASSKSDHVFTDIPFIDSRDVVTKSKVSIFNNNPVSIENSSRSGIFQFGPAPVLKMKDPASESITIFGTNYLASSSELMKAKEKVGALSESTRRIIKKVEITRDKDANDARTFIFEIINAVDGNEYFASGDNPSITFELANSEDQSYLWVGCNKESGDSDSPDSRNDKLDDEALRVVSEEHALSSSEIFGFTDTLWISMGAFQLRLEAADPSQEQCDISISWGALPAAPPNTILTGRCQTVFCFRLSKQSHWGLIAAGLDNIKEAPLLFLRKLTKLDFAYRRKREDSEVLHNRIQISTHDAVWCWPNQKYKQCKTICASQESSGGPIAEPTRKQYIFVESTIPLLEAVDKEGAEDCVERSDSLRVSIAIQMEAVDNNYERFAFGKEKGWISGRKFLEESGSPLHINANFKIGSSGDEKTRSSNNAAILDYIGKHFQSLVDDFNRVPILRYTWPSLIKLSPPYGSLAGDVYQAIRERLLSSELFYTESGTFAQLSDLADFGDTSALPRHERPELEKEDDAPFFEKFAFVKPRLHGGYQESTAAQLRLMFASSKTFLDGLKRYSSSDSFRKRPNSWHSGLAEMLLQNFKASEYEELLLIPLKDGRWVSPINKDLIFSTEKENGLPIKVLPPKLVIEEAAVRDPQRRQLYEHLGAKHLTPVEVCRLIFERHRNPDNSGSLGEFVEQAIYLFSVSEDVKQDLDLREMNFAYIKHPSELKPGGVRVGIISPKRAVFDFYLDDPTLNFRITSLVYKYPIRILHSSYLEYVRDRSPEFQTNWKIWLKSTFNLATLPKLSDLCLTTPIEARGTRIDSRRLLQLIRDNYEHYSKSLKGVFIRQQLRSMEVECLQGKRTALEKTVLPFCALRQVYLAKDALFFLDVDEVDSQGSNWVRLLADLGVLTEGDWKFHKDLLSAIAAPSFKLPENPDFTRIQEIYQSVENLVASSLDGGKLELEVRAFFNSHNAIIVRSPSAEQRITKCGPHDVVWQMPQILLPFCSSTVLKCFYPDMKDFFCKSIGVQVKKEVEPEVILQCIFDLASKEESKLEYEAAKKLLVMLSRSLENLASADDCFIETPRYEALRKLWKENSKAKIFPVCQWSWESSTESGKADLHSPRVVKELMSPESEALWIIADSKKCWIEFPEAVPMLDFNPDEIPLISKALDFFGIDERRFTFLEVEPEYGNAFEEILPTPESVVIRLSRQLRWNAIYTMRRLNLLRDARTKTNVKNLVVFQVPSRLLRCNHRIKFGGNFIKGKETTGRVFCFTRASGESSRFVFILSEEDIARNDIRMNLIVPHLTLYESEVDEKRLFLLEQCLRLLRKRDIDELLLRHGYSTVRSFRDFKRRFTFDETDISENESSAAESIMQKNDDFDYDGDSDSVLSQQYIFGGNAHEDGTFGSSSDEDENEDPDPIYSAPVDSERKILEIEAPPQEPFRDTRASEKKDNDNSEDRRGVSLLVEDDVDVGDSGDEEDECPRVEQESSVTSEDDSEGSSCSIPGQTNTPPRRPTTKRSKTTPELLGSRRPTVGRRSESHPGTFNTPTRQRLTPNRSTSLTTWTPSLDQKGKIKITDSEKKRIESAVNDLDVYQDLTGTFKLNPATFNKLVHPSFMPKDVWTRLGGLGEYFAFKFLEKVLGKRFQSGNWTSNYRNSILGKPRDSTDAFNAKQKDYSDITYHDTDGSLAQYFAQNHNFHVSSTYYHIEVKATGEECGREFYVSFNQQLMARKYSARNAANLNFTSESCYCKPTSMNSAAVKLENLYIIFRVYGLDYTDPKLRIYFDPWDKFLWGGLVFQPFTWNGFKVTPDDADLEDDHSSFEPT